MKHSSPLARRQFLARAGGAAFLPLGIPSILTASRTTPPIVIGTGDYRYEVLHNWPQLPPQFTWQTTQGAAIDRDGCLYVIHNGVREQANHPAIFAFDPTGKHIRSFGQEFQGGGHGIEVRQEDDEQFLYVCCYKHLKCLAKLTLHGDVVWKRQAPMQSGVYAPGEDSAPTSQRGRNHFEPTNFAFLPDGDLLVADGYGSFFIHRYTKDGAWKNHFGGPHPKGDGGPGPGTFNLPHGICFDARPGREPSVVICDRVNNRLQFVSQDGRHLETLDGFDLPANVEVQGDLLLVPELNGRVTLLDGKNTVIARLGASANAGGSDRIKPDRADPSTWVPGEFVHPHDACFDAQGNIIVVEWVTPGRVTRLRRV